MTESIHALAGYGLVTVASDVRATGVVCYQVTGPHLRGSIAFKPGILDDQAIPEQIIIQLGDGDHLFADYQDDLPVVHGITAKGGAVVHLDDPTWQHRLDLLRVPDRAKGTRPETTAELPDRSRRYLLTVISTLADSYRRLDVKELMHAAARTTANARLKRWTHGQILLDHRLLTEVRRDLTAAYSLADQLQALSPIKLPSTSAASRCPGRLPFAHPDTYISADDDGDWLTCPACDTRTVMIRSGDGLAGLLSAHAAHDCAAIRPS
ncbi:hypothetical protein BDK92_2624 [Micromonospora pisi]|uniref:Uncharacterized protein n=1 Tax=Micromonospora pisi TaxID=589240 RepID=A0A495JHF7_9ACTN|nr:hypothetical protein [Micromonospora pisi]RKR88313.1 hypothetical protein BDK92_2624 [Micromonospora pisi]